MPVEVAGALPLNYLTAYAAVAHSARPLAGERVLVHAAAGGVGLAAVQLGEPRGLIGVGLDGPVPLVRNWWDALLAAYAAGEIAPRVTALPLAEAAEAHRRPHARENVGKIVLVP
jgi:NADPH:quinone reductase-like Zn-dependent oxidoreductase